MGVNYNNRVITDGLVLYLDAANPKSYPGSGTTCYDLSENMNTGALINGVGYSSENKGSFTFDGLNDAITSSSANIPISTTVTVSAWVKHNTLPNSTQRYLTIGNEVAVIRHDGVSSSGQLHFYIRTNGTIKNALRVNNSLTTNTWYYVVGTWDGTTSRLYKNAVQIGTNVPGGTLNGGNLTFYILSSDGEPLNGNIAQVSVYNRALSADEITQNYNAFKGRFGL